MQGERVNKASGHGRSPHKESGLILNLQQVADAHPTRDPPCFLVKHIAAREEILPPPRSTKSPIGGDLSEAPTAADLSEAARLLAGLPGLIPTKSLVQETSLKEREVAKPPDSKPPDAAACEGLADDSVHISPQPPVQPSNQEPYTALTFWEGQPPLMSAEKSLRPLSLGAYDPMSIYSGVHEALTEVVQGSVKLAPATTMSAPKPSSAVPSISEQKGGDASARGAQEQMKSSGSGTARDFRDVGGSVQERAASPTHFLSTMHPSPYVSDDGLDSNRDGGSKYLSRQQTAPAGPGEGDMGSMPGAPSAMAALKPAADSKGKKGRVSRPPLRPSLNLQPSSTKRSG